jgi:xylan 1,4-beta-xylosidase
MERRFELTRRGFLTVMLGGLISSTLPVPIRAQRSFNLQVDASQVIGACDPTLWANIGYDPMYVLTLRPESQPAWGLIEQSRVFRYIRCHNAFSDGFPGEQSDEIWGCRVYSETPDGQPRYHFQYLDRVLDRWIKAGLKPILETDFMPDALAEGPIVRNYSGGAINTPRDYNKWRDLVYETVKHCLERYGAEEVRSWYFEIWNEPDLKIYFIDGLEPGERFTPEKVQRLNKMYDYFVAGATAADAQIKVGGPGLAWNPDYFRAFLSHCVNGTNYVTGRRGTRIDFISWHAYGTVDQIQRKNREMKRIIVREFPELADRELQQNEWGQPLGEDENRPSVYTQYEAAFLCKSIDGLFSDESAQVAKIVRWGDPTGHIPGQGWGWRPLTIFLKNFNNAREAVKLSVFNAYELLAKLGPERVQLTGTRFGDLVHGFATRKADGSVQIVAYHFDERNQQSLGAPVPVSLAIQGLQGVSEMTMTHYRIDQEHSNAYAAWVALGSPRNPTPAQIQQIKAKSELETLGPPTTLAVEGGRVNLSFELPVNAVSLIVLEPRSANSL